MARHPTTVRTLLITGVTRRVGAHVAGHWLRRGHRVIGTYRHDSPDLQALRAEGLIALPCDLNDPQSLTELVAAVGEHTDQLDAVIHNASVWYNDAACAAEPSRRDELFRVHVTAPLDLTEQLQQALPAKSQGGRAGRLVVFITDAHVPQGEPEHVHYIASKAAAEGAVRSLALKYAPHTRVNAIAPGLLMFHPEDSAGYRRDRLNRRMLPYEPGPHVVAQTLDYLLDCELVNAATLTLDGGQR